MENFGHSAITVGIDQGDGKKIVAHIDTWGSKTFTLRVGKKRYYFTDSDMFGPYLENKNGTESKNQPVAENHPFWGPYHMWRWNGRKGRQIGRFFVCKWRMPRKGQYYKDPSGHRIAILDEEFEGTGFVEVPKPIDGAMRDA